MYRTFNPCDECGYSYSKQNHESGMCKICEFKKMLDLDEQRKLLKLPCAVGDTVYRIDESDCEACETERQDINEKCTCKFGEFCGYEEVTKSEFKLDTLKDFGKTVFLTKEEAETALSELQR